MTTFKQLGLSDEVLKVLTELEFTKPSEIQEKAIPQLLDGDTNFIGIAQTGTGKTAAFGIPLLERIDTTKNYTQALVLAPTRELGQQIAEQLKTFSKYMNRVSVLPVYGGANISAQIKALKKPQHVIIATPGRLIDLIKRKAVKLENLKFMVLDEADEMLNMGFKEELDKILSYTPESKMTWLFSATMPREIKSIVNRYMVNPIEVKIDAKNQVNTNIEHQFVVLKQADKYEAFTRFMDINPDMRAVVFCRTKRDTQNLAEALLSRNYKADALHGDLSQAQRDRVMKRFKSHELEVLIATDVAARGIDVSDLSHVFHYTLPDDASYYTHRSGRTARAGKKGISIAFVNGREGVKIDRFEKKLKISFKKITVPKAAEIADIRVAKWCQNILEKDTNSKALKPELVEKANELFSGLSKEKLISKLLSQELEKLSSSANKDIAETAISKSRDGSSRGGRDDSRRGGRDGKRRRGGSGVSRPKRKSNDYDRRFRRKKRSEK